VVVVFGGLSYLSVCLKALTEQIDVQTPEVIVPWDERLGDVSRFRAEFPGVKFVAVKGRRTYAELRAIGVKQAHGKIVAITEDHCTPNVDWCVQILGAHARPHAAIGGAVEKQAPDTALNWALYLADYLRYMDPVPEGPAQSLTDCNVSYKRAALEAITEIWSNEFHEPSVHGALRARGDSLWLSPGIVAKRQSRCCCSGSVCLWSLVRQHMIRQDAVAATSILPGRFVVSVAIACGTRHTPSPAKGTV
jgi:hypothetical protein